MQLVVEELVNKLREVGLMEFYSKGVNSDSPFYTIILDGKDINAKLLTNGLSQGNICKDSWPWHSTTVIGIVVIIIWLIAVGIVVVVIIVITAVVVVVIVIVVSIISIVIIVVVVVLIIAIIFNVW